jgi:hypothetical protein
VQTSTMTPERSLKFRRAIVSLHTGHCR